MFECIQVLRQVRPDHKRESWHMVGGPQCPRKEHQGGPPAVSRDSPGPGPQSFLQEEALGTQVDYRKGMSGKIIDNAC